MQAALPAGHGDAPHAGARRRDRARGRVVAAGGGDLRLLGRRDLQRGAQRPPRATSPSASCRAAARASCPVRSGLPRDPVRAAERIRFGKPRRISLGRINGRLFAFNAGIGLDAELVRRVDALGRRRGRQATRRRRLRAGDRRRRWPSGASATRSRSRSRVSAARRSRSSPTARRTPMPGASGCASRPSATFEGGLDVVAPRRRPRREDPAAGGPGAPRPPARRADVCSATTSTGS